MAKDHRIVVDGVPQPFTCENKPYRTNIGKGEKHGNAQAKGSVFPRPIADDGNNSIWLEHVTQKSDGAECYWLMWYNTKSIPNIPMSSIMWKEDVEEMARLFASFALENHS